MIDLHCHFLPGIDDGAETLEQALTLAKMAVSDGISQCVLTPHLHPGRYDNDIESIRLAYEKFKTAVENAAIPLNLHMAAEARLSIELMQLISLGKVPYLGELGGEKVLLLELPHSHVPPGTDKFIKWLRDRGIKPMIAHPERNKEIMRNVAKIGVFVEEGCLLQLTAASVIGNFGEPAQQAAENILKNDWAFAIATDSHDSKRRPPVLGAAFRHIAAVWGEPFARCLCRDNPARILTK